MAGESERVCEVRTAAHVRLRSGWSRACTNGAREPCHVPELLVSPWISQSVFMPPQRHARSFTLSCVTKRMRLMLQGFGGHMQCRDCTHRGPGLSQGSVLLRAPTDSSTIPGYLMSFLVNSGKRLQTQMSAGPDRYPR